jgi:hypothetical protein
MKKHVLRFGLLICPLASVITLSSCVVPGYPGDTRYSSSRGASGVYNTLPTTFVGSAYYHDGRYYSGGNYQTGRYNYGGRQYTSRYYHNGNYIYGGRHQQYGAASNRPVTHDSTRSPYGSGADYRMGTRNSFSRSNYRR